MYDQEGIAFAAHRSLLRIALSAGVLAWPVLFVMNASTVGIERAFLTLVFAYVLIAVVTLWLAPLAAREVRHGLVRLLILGVLVRASAFAFLAIMADAATPTSILWTTMFFAALTGIARSLSAAPYGVISAELSSRTFAREFWVAAAPVLGGVLAVACGAPALLGAIALFALLSVVPLSRVQESYEYFSFGFDETFRHLISSRFRTVFWASFARGAESLVLYLIWPLTAFVLLGGSLSALGAVLTLCALAVWLSRGAMRAWRKRWPFSHGTVVSLRYVILGIVALPGGLILASVAAFVLAPDASDFEHAEDNGAYMDEMSVLKEMAAALGKVVMGGLVIAGLFVFPVPVILSLSLVAAVCLSVISSVAAYRSEPQPF